MKEVVVVTGVGDLAVAIIRRIGAGYRWVLADLSQAQLEKASHEFVAAGYEITTTIVEVVSKTSVESLARLAASLGPIHALVHTAGLSADTADIGQILKVNILGTAHVIEAFEPYLAAGSLAIMAASITGHADMREGIEQQIIALQSNNLASFIGTLHTPNAQIAYNLTKRSNLAQVWATASRWRAQGARIISIGTITPTTIMGPEEQKARPAMSYLLEQSRINGICSPEDVAAVVDLMCNPVSSLVTGFNVLVGKGVTVYTKLVNKLDIN